MSVNLLTINGWSRLYRRHQSEYDYSIFNIVVKRGGGGVRLRKRLPSHRTRVQADDNREVIILPRSTYLEAQNRCSKKKKRNPGIAFSAPLCFVGNVYKDIGNDLINPP